MVHNNGTTMAKVESKPSHFGCKVIRKDIKATP
jgi:hypothetical protein